MADTFYYCPIMGTCPYWLDKCKDVGCQHPEAIEMRAVDAPKDVVSEITAARGSTHGDYMAMSALIQATKDLWRGSSNWGRLHSGQKEALELIATKVGRILTGDPEYKDHWDDGAGYFTKGGECCSAFKSYLPYRTPENGA